MTKNEIIKWLELKLSPDLYRHSIAVQNMMEELALLYGVDSEKASLAGLVHDCAKSIPKRDLLTSARQLHITIDELMLIHPILLHAPLGAKIAELEFGIKDAEILRAVETHSIGSMEMSTLDRMLYVADSAEPNRDYPGVEKIRSLAFSGDLDGALLKAMDIKITYVVNKGLMLHPLTVEARSKILRGRCNIGA